MKNFKFSNILLLSLLALVVASFPAAATAQEPEMPQSAPSQVNNRRESLLRQLGLTLEQINQIRAINQDTRGQIRQAVQKQRDARRALDAAIYAGNPNNSEVEQRAREFGEAQAELSKLRARAEFRIRQVLTAEQLALFREMRRRAVEHLSSPAQPGFGSPRQNRPKRLPLKNRARF